MEFIQELEDIGIIAYIIKLLYTSYFSYYTSLKIINKEDKFTEKTIFTFINILIIAIICGVVKYLLNTLSCIILLIIMLSLILSKKIKNGYIHSMIVMTISLSINYIIFLVSTAITFIPTMLFNIKNMYVNSLIILVFYIILLGLFLKIKRFKKGFIFLQNGIGNDYLDIMVLNISAIILFLISIFSNYNNLKTDKIGYGLIIFAIVMFITIQKSLQLYYKQKLLIQELKETKSELEAKKKEVEELEKENLEFSKTSHTLAHKQRILEHKIEELSNKSEAGKEISVAEENNIKDTVQKISKELYTEVNGVELYKTEIPEIDDILKYMQSECIKNKIEFNIQIRGNIYKMINNIIPKEELQILIADHVKNAIIAINHSENINRSILIQIGKIMGNYGLYIYDSGIEFEKETLENLGKKPSTTHAEEGGTGMGFMNTFDTLRKYKASLEIEEIGNPSKDNYTKILKIKFDGKEEYKVKTYR